MNAKLAIAFAALLAASCAYRPPWHSYQDRYVESPWPLVVGTYQYRFYPSYYYWYDDYSHFPRHGYRKDYDYRRRDRRYWEKDRHYAEPPKEDRRPPHNRDYRRDDRRADRDRRPPTDKQHSARRSSVRSQRSDRRQFNLLRIQRLPPANRAPRRDHPPPLRNSPSKLPEARTRFDRHLSNAYQRFGAAQGAQPWKETRKDLGHARKARRQSRWNIQ